MLDSADEDQTAKNVQFDFWSTMFDQKMGAY